MKSIHEILKSNNLLFVNSNNDGLISSSIQEYADVFSIEFTKWIIENTQNAGRNYNGELLYYIDKSNLPYTLNELLQIFKDELNQNQ